MKKYKVAILTSHPIQYRTPLYKQLTKEKSIQLTVYFCSDFGVIERMDPDLGVKVKWDIPLLEGYKYKFLRNFSLKPSFNFFGQINPSIILELFKNKYDAVLIHGYAYFTNWLAFIGAIITKTPIMLGGEMVLRSRIPWWKKILKSVFLKLLLKTSSSFLAIGSFSYKFYKYYNVSNEKIFYTPYAIDNKRYIEAANKLKFKRPDIRNNLGIEKNGVVIIFVGKLIRKKRPLDLLRAFSILRFSDVHLLFVGDGSIRSELEEYVKENGLKNIHFAGFKNQTELPAYYIISDIFVLPSDFGEVSPLVVNEAMCFGLPIILSDAIPSSTDFVKQGENGFVFPIGNTEKLALCLKELIDNTKKRKSFGHKSLELIQEHSYEKDIEGTLKAIEYATRK